ncbi:MAG: hypothetical protein ACM3IJ_02240 [Candidatus Levyibacteriota bacterium]
MTTEDVLKIVDYIATECNRLKNKYIENSLEADYVCIFSHSEDEYNQLLEVAKTLGKIATDTPTGPVFAFTTRPETVMGSPKLLKIRKPDETRAQRGDLDLNTNYPEFKKKYLNNNEFTLIVRPDFEMIELKDDSFDALLYFSSIPLSKQLGIT